VGVAAQEPEAAGHQDPAQRGRGANVWRRKTIRIGTKKRLTRDRSVSAPPAQLRRRQNKTGSHPRGSTCWVQSTASRRGAGHGRWRGLLPAPAPIGVAEMYPSNSPSSRLPAEPIGCRCARKVNKPVQKVDVHGAVADGAPCGAPEN